MLDFLKSIKINILGSAVLCVILGIVLVAYPDTSLTIVCRAVGGIVLLTGVGFVLGCIRNVKHSFFAKIGLSIGSIFVILGGFIVLFPSVIISIIPLVFGVLLIYHGIENVSQAWELRKYEECSWWLPVLVAASTILLGFLILKNPFGTMETLMRMIGACLIYDGLSNTMLVGHFVRSVRNYRKLVETEAESEKVPNEQIEPEVIEGEFIEL